MKTTCPHCNTVLPVRAAFLGKKVKCSHCGNTFVAKQPPGPSLVPHRTLCWTAGILLLLASIPASDVLGPWSVAAGIIICILLGTTGSILRHLCCIAFYLKQQHEAQK